MFFHDYILPCRGFDSFILRTHLATSRSGTFLRGLLPGQDEVGPPHGILQHEFPDGLPGPGPAVQRAVFVDEAVSHHLVEALAWGSLGTSCSHRHGGPGSWDRMGRQIAGQIPDDLCQAGSDLSLGLPVAAWADEGRGASHPASIRPAPSNLGLDLLHLGFFLGVVVGGMGCRSASSGCRPCGPVAGLIDYQILPARMGLCDRLSRSWGGDAWEDHRSPVHRAGMPIRLVGGA